MVLFPPKSRWIGYPFRVVPPIASIKPTKWCMCVGATENHSASGISDCAPLEDVGLLVDGTRGKMPSPLSLM